MPTRGEILRLTRAQAGGRAFSQIIACPTPPVGAPPDAGNRPISYRLEEQNGGLDPEAAHCASWSYGNRTPTADCIGFVLWASGIDRKQPGYAGSRGEWLNCASLLDDADGARVYCEPGNGPRTARVGDWLLTDDHIGFIVRAERHWWVNTREQMVPLLVIDCSPRHGYLNSIQIGEAWSPHCRVIRPKVYSEP